MKKFPLSPRAPLFPSKLFVFPSPERRESPPDPDTPYGHGTCTASAPLTREKIFGRSAVVGRAARKLSLPQERPLPTRRPSQVRKNLALCRRRPVRADSGPGFFRNSAKSRKGENGLSPDSARLAPEPSVSAAIPQNGNFDRRARPPREPEKDLPNSPAFASPFCPSAFQIAASRSRTFPPRGRTAGRIRASGKTTAPGSARLAEGTTAPSFSRQDRESPSDALL